LFGRHRPPTDHDSHGHAAPVDTGRPANGTWSRETGSNSRRPGRKPLSATCGELLARALLPGLGSPQPRFPAITGSPQSEPACDPRHTPGEWAPDLRKHRTGQCADETRKGSFHRLGAGFTSCGQSCGTSTGLARSQRPARGNGRRKVGARGGAAA
jgi:hypothetical protein